MSLNALVNQNIYRNRAAEETSNVEGSVLTPRSRTFGESEAEAASVPPSPGGGPPKPNDDALNKLVKYIPTESITLFVAAMAAAPGLAEANGIKTEQLYWFFCFFTPVILLLMLLGKRKSVGQTAWPPVKEFPFWELIAAFIAFMVWALAVPGGPYMQGGSKGVVAGFLAVLISSFLSLLEPLFTKRPTV